MSHHWKKYHATIFSKVNDFIQLRAIASDSMSSTTDIPPSSLSIAMIITMYLMLDPQPQASLPTFEMLPLVQHSLADGEILCSILDDILKKTS